MKKLKIIPRKKYVLVKPDGKELPVSKSGLFTPGSVEQEQKSVGTVMQTGEDVVNINRGSKVIYATYAGEWIELDDISYKLLHDDDVLAFLE